jgi:RHS repeat-associated protein
MALMAALVIAGLLPYSAHGMYDPKHGRWLQRDPAGYVGGMNLCQ